MNTLKNILVGVDFSESSRAAIEQAARIAAWNDARLHVIHALDTVVVRQLAFALKVSDLEMREIAGRRATETLREWVQELRLAEEPEMEIGIGTPLEVVL